MCKIFRTKKNKMLKVWPKRIPWECREDFLLYTKYQNLKKLLSIIRFIFIGGKKVMYKTQTSRKADN